MTPVTIAVVLTAGALFWLWRLRLKLPPAGLIGLAMPLAMLPIAAAATTGAARFKSGLERIGETGSGGFRQAAGLSLDWTWALLAGLGALLLIVAASLMLAYRGRRSLAPQAGPPRLAATVGLMLIAGLSIGATAWAVAWMEWAALGSIVKLGGGLPDLRPLGFSNVAAMPTGEWVGLLGRVVLTAARGGALFCAGLVLAAWLGRAMARRVSSSREATSAAIGLAVAVLGATVWASIDLGRWAIWLKDLQAV
jgi:hypothetical protein